MKVLLDATAVPADRGGVGRYVDALAPQLPGAGVTLAIVTQARDAEYYRNLVPQAAIIAAPAFITSRPARMAWEQTGLAQLAHRHRPDVVHSPHYTMPLAAGVPVAVTLHDATFFTLPDAHLPIKRAFFTQAIRHATRHAGAIIVPSAATRDEVIREAGGDAGSFYVAYHGVDRGIFHPATPADQLRVRATLGLSPDPAAEPYLAFLGTLEPRKNLSNLVRAWTAVSRDLANPPTLVLAGGKGWDTELDDAIAQVPGHLRVIRPGYLPLDDLPGYLSGAELVAYPSIGEGFGLPVLEAMACGASVLTTRELALPEVGGDAVAYCGITAAAIEHELRRLLAAPERRAALAAAATERAAEFTWQRAAQVHASAYEHAARTRGATRQS